MSKDPVKRNPALNGKRGENGLNLTKIKNGAERKPEKYLLPVIPKKKTVIIKKNGIVVDSNILINNPDSLNVLRENGKNTVFIPVMVMEELDHLKSKPGVGLDVSDVSLLIEEIMDRELKNNIKPSLCIIKECDWKGLEGLSQNKNDHNILASINWLLRNKSKEFNKIKFLSRDRIMRIFAKNYLQQEDFMVEDYYHDQSNNVKSNDFLKITVPYTIIKKDKDKNGIFWFDRKDLSDQDKKKLKNVKINSGVICSSNWDGNLKTVPRASYLKFQASFVAITKGEKFKIVDKKITAFGIRQYSINGNGPNYPQMAALDLLMDNEVVVVILEGGAGSGKTLLSVAAALEQIGDYNEIIITRPQVHLANHDNMGYLPGNIDRKMSPWLKPIAQALNELDRLGLDKLENDQLVNNKNSINENIPSAVELEAIRQLKNKYRKEDLGKQARSKNGRNRSSKSSNVKNNKYSQQISKEAQSPTGLSLVEQLKNNHKLSVESLDYIRGQNICGAFLIVDEAQNLTVHEIKSIITRIGLHAKVVCTGDLSQIDLHHLDRKSSGLAYAIEKLTNLKNLDNPELAEDVHLVGVVNFKDSVRSKIASYAEKVL